MTGKQLADKESLTGLPRVYPKSIGEYPQKWRLTKPGEETCDTGTCNKCGAVYERFRHFDYCPICEPEGMIRNACDVFVISVERNEQEKQD
jgi:hypothetical protein